MALQQELDRLLQAAADAGDVPGVVALAATPRWCHLPGRGRAPAPARRRVDEPRNDVLDRLDGQAGRGRGGDAAGRAGQAFARAECRGDLSATRRREGAGRVRRHRRAAACAPPGGRSPLRHLLTHTAGYGYEHWNADMRRYVQQTGLPGASGGQLVALDAPLLFDPGERWEYGISIDWLGRLVDAVSGQDPRRLFARAHLRTARHARHRLSGER